MNVEQKIRNDIIQRVPLSKVIPLETPYRLGIDVANGCNFRCIFCFHSVKARYLKEMGFKAELMNMDTFGKLVEQIHDFPGRFKSITFGGIGEPLLHKNLPKMIRMIRKIDKSDRISLVTNGALLNENFSKALIDEGLDEMIISIEALSSEGYHKIANASLDFGKYIRNIEFLYQYRKECKIYAKIVDVSFDYENAESKFHKIFDAISDLAYVETIVPRYKHVEYAKMNYTNENLSLKHKVKADICSLPFYSVSIFPSGNVDPCCVDYCETIVLGNIHEEPLLSIWRGDRLRNFRLAHLKKDCNHPVCKGCKFTQHNGRAEDIIDKEADQLATRI